MEKPAMIMMMMTISISTPRRNWEKQGKEGEIWRREEEEEEQEEEEGGRRRVIGRERERVEEGQVRKESRACFSVVLPSQRSGQWGVCHTVAN
jgi:hypothetical protein